MQDPHLLFFFFKHTATTEIYTLSLHDALPIFTAHPHPPPPLGEGLGGVLTASRIRMSRVAILDRKSTRLNSSHVEISYAVFCLKKKNKSKTCRELTERQHSTVAGRAGRCSCAE